MAPQVCYRPSAKQHHPLRLVIRPHCESPLMGDTILDMLLSAHREQSPDMHSTDCHLCLRRAPFPFPFCLLLYRNITILLPSSQPTHCKSPRSVGLGDFCHQFPLPSAVRRRQSQLLHHLQMPWRECPSARHQTAQVIQALQLALSVLQVCLLIRDLNTRNSRQLIPLLQSFNGSYRYNRPYALEQ